MQLINWTLARNPWNWAIILLMVLIGGLGADIVLTAIHTNSNQDS